MFFFGKFNNKNWCILTWKECCVLLTLAEGAVTLVSLFMGPDKGQDQRRFSAKTNQKQTFDLFFPGFPKYRLSLVYAIFLHNINIVFSNYLERNKINFYFFSPWMIHCLENAWQYLLMKIYFPKISELALI